MNQIIQGDALSVLKSLENNSIQMVCTSQPYYCQRMYLPDGHPDKALEIGLEETPAEFIQRLVEIFREVRRVLHPSGTLWINIGDTYANDKKYGGSTSGKHVTPLHGSTPRDRRYTGLPAGNLVGIPWRLALALQDEGWILRSDIIWAKSNPLPEPVDNRPTKSHEHIFLMAKSCDYFYNANAIREPHTTKSNLRDKRNENCNNGQIIPFGEGLREWNHPDGRNKRDVWTMLVSRGVDGAHFATMPQKLAEICILAGSAPGDLVLDPFAGSGTSLLVAARYLGIELSEEYIALAEKRLAVLQPKLWGLEAV